MNYACSGRHFSSLIFVAVLSSLLLVVTLISCSDDEGLPPKGPTVQLTTNATLGSVLQDSLGFTLYSFANDVDGNNNCSGGCALQWPAYYAGEPITDARLVTGLNAADFGTITTSGGLKQTTYKGWPLYYFAPSVNGVNTRENAGEVKGEGFGGIWQVAKPDYSIRLLNAQLVGLDGKSYKSDYTEGAGKTLFFTDANGATLYHFSKDSFHVNKFTRPDLSNNSVWPVYENTSVVVPSTLDKTLFGQITVGGKKQLTYKGWPMYYFGQDSQQRGSTKGVSVGPAPGTWQVVIKDAVAAPTP